MPKIKTAKVKSSKLLSKKKFRFDKRFVFALAALAVAGGGYVFYLGTHAASTGFGVYQYNSKNCYDAPSTTGQCQIYHHGGGVQTRVVRASAAINSASNKNLTMWAGTDGGSLDAVDTGRMWFGPYTVMGAPSNRNLHVCWKYVSPDYKDAKVQFEVTYNGGRDYIYNSGSKKIESDYPGPSQPGGQRLWDMKSFCVDKRISYGAYKSFEIRVKMLDGGSKPEDAFRLWRTSWDIR